MSISKLIKENYENNNKKKSITLEDWGMTIYVAPLTVGQMQEINQAKTNFDLCLKTIEVRAKDENGNRIMTPADVDEIRKFGMGMFGPDRIVEIAGLINEDMNELEEAAKKTS